MDFKTIVSVITEAGVSVACSAVLVLVFYKLINRHLKESERLRKASEEQNRKMFEKILEYTPYSITPQKYEEDVAVDKEINNILKLLMKTVNPARAFLVTFHNGGKDLSGLSFLKMSMRNEIVAPSIKPLQPEFQGIFRNTLSYWCNELAENGHCYVEDYRTLAEVDRSFYDFLNTRDVFSIFGKAIVDNENHIIGFVAVEFMTKPSMDVEQIKRCLRDKKIKLETVLNMASN